MARFYSCTALACIKYLVIIITITMNHTTLIIDK